MKILRCCWLLPALLFCCCYLRSVATISEQCAGEDLHCASSSSAASTSVQLLSFVFTESFPQNSLIYWNGKSYRRQRGLSGSHAASIFLAEALAARGHRVYFIGDSIMTGEYNGVSYINTRYIGVIHCDVFVTTYNMNDLLLMTRLQSFVTQKIVALMNNPLYPIPADFHRFLGPRFTFAHVSNMERINTMKDGPWMAYYQNRVMYNSLNISELLTPAIATSTATSPHSGAVYATSINMGRKQKRFVFFPCFERGGLVAWKVAQHFPDFKFVTVTYAQGSAAIREKLGDDPHQQIVYAHSSRNEILHELLRSKYFVYPLINMENFQIHYDTFAYVVLEALLHGVIVVAPRMACYEELYGDAIAYVEVDDLIPADAIYRWNHQLPALGGEVMVQRYVAKIRELEGDEALSLQYIEAGLQLATKFDNAKIALEFEEYLWDDLLKMAEIASIEGSVHSEQYDPRNYQQ